MSELTLNSVNPSNGKQLGAYPCIDLATLGTRLKCADAAYQEWSKSTPERRSECIHALADSLEKAKASLAGLMTDEMGKPISESRGELEKGVELCRWYGDELAALLAPTPCAGLSGEAWIEWSPLGPIVGIMPWNYPVWQVLRFAVPTLGVGNTVLLKHAPNVTGTALALAQCFHEAGFTEGIYTPLTMDVGLVDRAIADPRVAGVSITGSVAAGQSVARSAGANLKPSLLELGGSDPFIVLEDANLDAAVNAAAQSRMLNCGQSCISAKRFIVVDALHDAFVEGLSEKLASLVVGEPQAEQTQVGPLARADLVSTLLFQVRASVEQGAECVLGGAPLERPGNFFAPTILTHVAPGMPVFDEETFGPVAAVVRASDEDAAVTLANATNYGLGAAIFSERRGRALVSRIAAGYVAVNQFVRSDWRLPFGGIKHSGYGRELGAAGLRSFANLKTVWIQE